MSNPTLLQKLPTHHHKFFLVFDSKEAETLPDNNGCDHRIELTRSEEKFRMGPIYQLSQKEEKLLIQYLDKMIKEGKIQLSSSTVGSPILFIPKLNGNGSRLCVDSRYFNDYTPKDNTPLPIMVELHNWLARADYITRIYMKSRFHLLRMALGNEKFTSLRTKCGLYEYMVMPFGLMNTPATFQPDIIRIFWPLLGIQLVLDSKIHINGDKGMAVEA